MVQVASTTNYWYSSTNNEQRTASVHVPYSILDIALLFTSGSRIDENYLTRNMTCYLPLTCSLLEENLESRPWMLTFLFHSMDTILDKNWFIYMIGYALLQNLELWIEVAVNEHRLALQILQEGLAQAHFSR